MSSGCIISEAMATGERWMSISGRTKLGRWERTLVLVQLEISVAHFLKGCEALSCDFFLLLS